MPTFTTVKIEHQVTCGDEPRWSGEQVLAASWLDKHTSMQWPEVVKAKLESFLPPPATVTVTVTA